MDKEHVAQNWPVHPGEILQEHMQARGLALTDLARRTGLNEEEIVEVMRGQCPVTARMALWLERIFDLSAETWLRLQNLWDLHQVRQEEAA